MLPVNWWTCVLINVFNLQVTVENFIRILTGKATEVLSHQVIVPYIPNELLAFLAAQRFLKIYL